MKVSELIEELKKFDQDAIVILQKDAEGNGYSPLDDVDQAGYTPESTWSGEVQPKVLTPELEKAGWTEEDINPDGEDCVVLAPVN